MLVKVPRAHQVRLWTQVAQMAADKLIAARLAAAVRHCAYAQGLQSTCVGYVCGGWLRMQCLCSAIMAWEGALQAWHGARCMRVCVSKPLLLA